MGGRMSRGKGQRGERELADILSAWLGMDIKRKLGQAREGGADILDVPGLVIEVKRQETLCLPAWWRQVNKAAQAKGGLPVLAFRQNGRKWQFCIPCSLIGVEGGHFITLQLNVFLSWLLVYTSKEMK